MRNWQAQPCGGARIGKRANSVETEILTAYHEYTSFQHKLYNSNTYSILLACTESAIQRVPINIVHGEINDFLKSRSD